MDCGLQAMSVSNVVDEAVNTILALQSQDAKTDESDSTKVDAKEDINDAEAQKREEDIKLIRQGWTLENCGLLCVGELYLMVGDFCTF